MTPGSPLPPRPVPPRRAAGWGRRARGIVAGLLAGAAGLAIGSLVAAVSGPTGSPLNAVGQAAIDLTPPPVKNFAIAAIGSHDKLALQLGMLVVLAVLAALTGLAALRDERAGLAAIGGFAVIGLIAAQTRPTARVIDVLPTLIGAAAAGFTLIGLVRAARPAPGAAPASAAGAGEHAEASRQAETSRQAGAAASRRRFMARGLAAAGGAVIASAGGRLLTEHSNVAAAERAIRLPAPASPAGPPPPGASLQVPGLGPFVTPTASFYRVDTALVIPQVPPSSWRLRIHGMVSRELTLSFGELLRRPLTEDYITLACVSNPVGGPYVGNARWLGASVGSLLREAGIRAGADQLFCTSADGFTCGSPVQTAMDGRDALLAVGMNGAPLPTSHGFPVRMVVPGLYGYVSACKWITDIEVTTYAANTAYWARRGWSARAPIKTECRIDVPGGFRPLRPGPTAIAGVAWAQHKGIDAVEVRTGGGPWRQATLAAVPGIDCWRQWAADWDATAGSHVIEARATDATGYTQTALATSPEPDGATGYPSVTVTVSG